MPFSPLYSSLHSLTLLHYAIYRGQPFRLPYPRWKFPAWSWVPRPCHGSDEGCERLRYLIHPFNHSYNLPYLALSCLTLFYLTLPYLTLPYLTLPYPTLPYPTLPYLTLPYLTLPYLTLPYLTLPYLTLPYLTLPYLILFSYL